MKIYITIKTVYRIISCLLAVAAIYIYFVVNNVLKTEKYQRLGNSDRIIGTLADYNTLPFSFAFISDTENADSSLWLIKTILKENIDFLVFVGDFVNDSLWSEHKLFLQTISRNNPMIPIFLVQGNHDVNLSNDNIDSNVFNLSDFRKLYGPENYSFEYNNSLFIFLSNINPENDDYIDYLNEVLLRKNNRIKHTFIFMHVPPAIMKYQAYNAPLYKDKLDDIIKRHKIDYIICGDYHKHLEYTDDINNNRYIISGSGGAHYHGDSPWGKYKSATKITVENNGIVEERLIAAKYIVLTDNSIRRYLCNKFFKLWQYNILFNAIVIIIVLNALFSVFAFKATRRLHK